MPPFPKYVKDILILVIAGVSQSVWWLSYLSAVRPIRSSGSPTGRTEILPLQCRDRLCDSPNLLFSEYRESFPYLKRPRLEADHSLSSGAEIKNAWNCNFPLRMP